MRSIQRKFNKIEKQNPNWSSYLCFVNAIKGQKFVKKNIQKQFYKLVDKNDYDWKNRISIINDLVKISNCAEEGANRHKINFTADFLSKNGNLYV